jgi:hypothetical protein
MEVAWNQYDIYFQDALARYDRRDFADSADSWSVAISLRDNAYARWNRSQARLSVGDFEAFGDDFAARWTLFADIVSARGRAILDRLPRWRGEDITRKRLLLVHEQGFGDSIMLLRFLPMLRRMGIKLALEMPPPLHLLALQFAPLGEHGDVACPMFDILNNLAIMPPDVPSAPYLMVPPSLRQEWAQRIGPKSRRRIGIAWTYGLANAVIPSHLEPRDFLRAVRLAEFLELLDADDCEIFSLQKQEGDLARAHGVRAFDFVDFADVAALGSLMDAVVSIDTAAVHAVAASGHPNVSVMLPYLSSWRWLGKPIWYPHVRRCQQTAPGDWASAFAQLHDDQNSRL